MCPLRSYPVLRLLLSPFRGSQRKTLAWVIASIAECREARTRSIAGVLARRSGVGLGSAINRFYRLLKNRRIEDQRLTEQLLRLLGDGRTLLIALDWTKWPHQLQALLASVIIERRAVPIQVRVTPDRDIWQNKEEARFLACLAKSLIAAGQEAVFLCDRGFHRVAWIRKLKSLRHGFVVRLCGNLMVYPTANAEEGTLLSEMPLARGEISDLGKVWLREDKAVRVRVIGVWRRKQKERWWLATNLSDKTETPHRVAAIYAKRMDIEEQIRDTKGCRFGAKLEWNQLRTPARLARLTLLLGVALLLWLFAGIAKAAEDPAVRMISRKKGARVSLVQVGLLFLQDFKNRISARFIKRHFVNPKLTCFADLHAIHIQPGK